MKTDIDQEIQKSLEVIYRNIETKCSGIRADLTWSAVLFRRTLPKYVRIGSNLIYL